MSVVHAAGFHVRHALGRALATTNRPLAEATFRVLAARVVVDARGRVTSAEVTVRVEAPRPLRGDDEEIGLVNPDGLHPLMARIPGAPRRLLDIWPVSWDRWARVTGRAAPPGTDPMCPVVGPDFAEAAAYARAVGKALPEAEDLRGAWGRARHPWGDAPDPALGRAEAPRFGEWPEVGMHPPTRAGFHDVGAWLHQWTADGGLYGGLVGLAPGGPDAAPRGLRCVQEV